MALSHGRIVAQVKSPYAHEQAAVDFAIHELPDEDPLHLWALVDLLDPSTGRLHEIDLLVLGYSALYVVEVKSYPGRIQGDSVDWIWTPPDGPPLTRDNPRRLTYRKAQILASRLQRAFPAGMRTPWVEPLVFLSDPDLKLDLRADGAIGVVTRRNFAKAITHGKYPGADPRRAAERLNTPTARATIQALAKLGIRPRKQKLAAGTYELGELLSETDSFQDRLATHQTIRSQTRRARTYLVPEQTSVERRQQLRRAADREAQLLYEVREHPNILPYTDYVADAPLGPTVLFDAFEGGVPLDRFVRLDRELSFGERIAIIEQVGRALDHCHKKQVVHGGVCPAAVLVRRDPTRGIETRLFNFQLGQSEAVTATSHWTDLAAAEWAVYQAPELRRDPTQRTVEADLFSLGALAYFALTGRDPAVDVVQVEEILRQRRCLDPRAVDDSVPEKVAQAVELATCEVILQRADDVGAWLDILLQQATEPEAPAAPEPSPLEARGGEALGDLQVYRVLGHGASSRVLEVERDGRIYALKVSLGPEHDERLAAEAEVLAHLRHARIVQLIERLTIAGRTCLLLSLAGDRTLYRELASEGAPSLDYASRWGEELLSALEHLEELEIVHRDIKPANIGVGAVGKKARSLHLFDFSLAAAPFEDVRVGTAAYRDPHLPERGRWDHAADRYSAAITLHELLTGARPTVTEDGTVKLAAERFDPSVRGSLGAFFERAFAPAADGRFPGAADMRHAWIACFDGRALSDSDAEPTRRATELSDEEVRAVAPETPIAALPLSTRARNALDRAGLLTAADLLALPQNRLSAIRGAGRLVTSEIHEFRTRWESLVPAVADSGPLFFPGYHGEDLIVAIALPPAAADILTDAGIRTLGQLAATPSAHIETLARRHGLDVPAAKERLAAENRTAEERDRPTTLEGWVQALFGGKKKRDEHVRALMGLGGPHAGTIGLSPREMAGALGQTVANIYMALGKAREVWAAHPAFALIAEPVHAFVADEGGAAPLEQVADWLCTQLAHDESSDPALRRVQAAALVRAVCEVERDEATGLRFARLHNDQPWVLERADMPGELRRLGELADELAARPVLAGAGETERALRGVLEPDSPLALLQTERLIRLAAAASRTAAASPRLELYPRAMPGARALELSAAALSSGLSPDELRRRVAARYPAAEPLPERPALDDLVASHELHFDAATGQYLRAGERGHSSLHTSYQSYTRLSGHPAVVRDVSEAEIVALEFEDRVKSCLERRSLLVLGVPTDRAEEAARALAARFSLRRHSFDAAFLAALDHKLAEDEIDPEVVHETDAAGSAADAWPLLTDLGTQAAAAVARDLLPPKAPLLLTEPGLVHRYQLTDFLRTLVDASRQDDAEAIVLLVPGRGGGTPTIEGKTVIPGLLPGQMTWLPTAWLAARRAG